MRKRLYLYSALQNFASSLYGPFVSFVAATEGMPPLLLGLVSSAGTVFNNLSAFLVSFRRWRPINLITAANVVSAIALIAMAIYTDIYSVYALAYALVAMSLGASGYGWSLLLEQFTRRSRGISLAQFSFYSTLGGLAATLITGLLMRNNPMAIKLSLLAAAGITLANTAQLRRLGVRYEEGERPPASKMDRRLVKFYLGTFVFVITWSFAWPLFPLAQVYIYHMNGLQVAVLQIITVVSTLAFQRPMGAFVERHKRLSLFLGRATFMTWPLIYGVANNVYEIFIAYMFFGFGGSISNVAYFAYVVDNAEDKRRALGYFNLVNAAGALVGSELSSAILSYIQPNERVIREMLIASALARLGASFLYLL
ncbi:MFS transporter [Thermoproteus tenax]|uniref:Permease of the major facilitator superfamily n=1 Tax=Thermoproteus tenax (strain ATCC 35583 / DSM 2078 / JCM 9277 / NBRC 100435 / Kra 1) TaxID=768679 RepID=G4RN08_THETK|nr:MFS transporter [Thermoproteus tenax]CCC80952.1 permease of the major facilitator superfamily [Thermoproteus tenax Kra 1]